MDAPKTHRLSAAEVEYIKRRVGEINATVEQAALIRGLSPETHQYAPDAFAFVPVTPDPVPTPAAVPPKPTLVNKPTEEPPPAPPAQ